MDEILRNLPGVSIEGILLIIIIREIASFLRVSWDGKRVEQEQKKIESLEKSIDGVIQVLNESRNNHAVQTAVTQISDLHRWHAITDNDGIPVWYVRRDFTESIMNLTKSIDLQAKAVTEAINELKGIQREVMIETRNIQRDVGRMERDFDNIKVGLKG